MIIGILESPLTGNCKIDVYDICMNDWLPKLDSTKSKLCRDAFITYNKSSNKYRLAFVRGYKIVTKINIRPSDAEEIISMLGLRSRQSSVFNAVETYRLTWFHVDFLSCGFPKK